MAVMSWVALRASWFSDSMSPVCWTKASPSALTAPLKRPQNMNASSESGLWATRIVCGMGALISFSNR